MSDTVKLTVPAEWSKVVYKTLEDKAAHSILVAEEQRERENEDGAEKAEARAEVLRQIAAPLKEQVEAEERAEAKLKAEAAAERLAKLDAEKAERKAKKAEAAAVKAAEAGVSKERKAALKEAARAAKKADKRDKSRVGKGVIA